VDNLFYVRLRAWNYELKHDREKKVGHGGVFACKDEVLFDKLDFDILGVESLD